MRVLIIHNSYQYPGGEDVAVRAEAAALESAGHKVIRYFRSNHAIAMETLSQKAKAAANVMWSSEAYGTIREIIRRECVDIAHCHNLFPLISPSAYSACQDEGIPVVQTLHNFRLLCPCATLFRSGGKCEQCIRMKNLFPGIVHGCYRESRSATALVASMLAFHRGIGTWETKVDVYIALSEFARRKFEEGGLAGSRIEVKCNLTNPSTRARVGGDFGVFVGRLASEKGVATLLRAWKASGTSYPLRIIGDGPLRCGLERECEDLRLNQVHFEGHLDARSALEAIQNSRFLVFPSECYENCPMTILEAFACGAPVIASRLGSTEEMVEDWRTGRLFESGNADQLAAILNWAFANRGAFDSIGQNARAEYEAKYEPTQNLRALERIYERAIAFRKRAPLN